MRWRAAIMAAIMVLAMSAWSKKKNPPANPSNPPAGNPPANAPDNPTGPFAGFKSSDKTPVEIHADRMEADLAGKKLHFMGHVWAKQGKRTIYAERIDVNYIEGGKVTLLTATGNVKVNFTDSFATCDKLVLDNVKQIIYLYGHPRLVQGTQIIVGDKMTYEIGPEKLYVTNPKIQWTPTPEDSQKGKKEKKGKNKPAAVVP